MWMEKKRRIVYVKDDLSKKGVSAEMKIIHVVLTSLMWEKDKKMMMLKRTFLIIQQQSK